MRAFAPGVGVAEDPACGSMNASVGQWLTSTGAASSTFKVSQGTMLGRTGEITITADTDGTVLGRRRNDHQLPRHRTHLTVRGPRAMGIPERD